MGLKTGMTNEEKERRAEERRQQLETERLEKQRKLEVEKAERRAKAKSKRREKKLRDIQEELLELAAEVSESASVSS